MDLAIVVQPFRYLLEVRTQNEIVVHRSGSRTCTGLGDRAPSASGQHFGEAIGALRTHAAFAPPVIHFRHVGRTGSAFDHAVHAVGEMDEPGDVVGRRVNVGELAAPGSLGDDPFGFGIAVVPARVIHEVRNHVHQPAGGGSVDGLDAPESAA